MSSFPVFRPEDALAPYDFYRVVARLVIESGGLQLPLAYTGRKDAAGVNLPTSRLIQGKQPTCSYVVEWSAARAKAKPEPPRIVTLGDFILSLAGGQVDGINKNAEMSDLILASGFYVLHSSNRPEDAILPAFWCPWDGRYGTAPSQVAQYSYTPAELGFGQFLPGAATPNTSGNPTLQNSTSGNQVK